MTVNELILHLQKVADANHGELIVCLESKDNKVELAKGVLIHHVLDAGKMKTHFGITAKTYGVPYDSQ